jgi:hypothetical protein
MTDGMCEERQLFSDAFHALNQPLTALHCALEVTLARHATVDECRQTMANALLQVEHITVLVRAIGELVQAADAGVARTLSLDAFVRDAVAEWLPLAQAASIGLLLQVDASCVVSFDPRRLAKAWFHAMDFLIYRSAPGSVVRIGITCCAGEAIIAATLDRGKMATAVEPVEEDKDPVLRQLGLGIARRIFEAAGGTLRVVFGPARLSLLVQLPALPAEASVGDVLPGAIQERE